MRKELIFILFLLIDVDYWIISFECYNNQFHFETKLLFVLIASFLIFFLITFHLNDI